MDLLKNLNNMEEIPTAEEYLTISNEFEVLETRKQEEVVTKTMIEFAKLHVEAALKEAEKETVKHISKTILELNMYNKDSILNAYTLENIK